MPTFSRLNLLNLFRQRIMLFLLISSIVLIILRFVFLTVSPPGFYMDEAVSGAHVITMVQSQTNAFGQAWPFYSRALGGGFTTPVYLYPLALWASIFGFSEFALRAFSQFVTILAILVVALCLWLWLGKRAAAIAMIVGLALPWSWLQGSIAWDPVLVPLFVSLAMFSWSLLATQSLPKRRLLGFIGLPLSLSLVAYAYPPYWAVVPFFIIAAYGSLFLWKRITVRHLIFSATAMIVLLIPLLFFIITPGTLGRASIISVFHDTSFMQAIGLFIRNMFLLSNPFFLFIYGDSNMRQSIGIQGALGLGALAPIVVLMVYGWRRARHRTSKLLKSTEAKLLLIAIVGYILALIGSALTKEGQPHSLRATGAWPFAIIIVTIGWVAILRVKAQWMKWTAITMFILATIAYAIDLSVFYPMRSKSFFDVGSRSKISQHQHLHYPPLALKYYQNR
ncbi:MAG: hypothetical protein EOT05_00630 [Candidatus Microsaccharimonas sossegonensis]|uniref:Glycosyltransferase RgtA/B/C/D-like domain-containing protein n=1 Tax=Candidatus Microsaccharimonas sossegonensis TaxID=2506948 RepID=A0A4Q0AI28_9BACT|nr:MAG: hypothetical protein EOT05_00630 [Candidatus Microsaccharimonas sossegonensis]